jgi:CRP-like cAMP-binding protein
VPDKEDLNRIPLFSKLNEEEIRRCTDSSSEELFLQSGEEFITEGKNADYFYVLLSGTVQVTRKVSDKNEASLGTLGVGKYMGKVLLLLLLSLTNLQHFPLRDILPFANLLFHLRNV